MYGDGFIRKCITRWLCVHISVRNDGVSICVYIIALQYIDIMCYLVLLLWHTSSKHYGFYLWFSVLILKHIMELHINALHSMCRVCGNCAKPKYRGKISPKLCKDYTELSKYFYCTDISKDNESTHSKVFC
jgi:hypothetical protein